MQRFLRYLRIGTSAASCIAAVLFMMMWERSYLWMDKVFGPISATSPFELSSERGRVHLFVSDVSLGRAGDWGALSYRYDTVLSGPPPRSGVVPSNSNFSLTLPYWLLVMLAAAVAIYAGKMRDREFAINRRAGWVVGAIFALALVALLIDLYL